ncbi:hypothetical protein [Vibrio vulnificus]|uniref:hypothetical protein n=1 Tax=Vibrio vulnificus TaxID=672 RepID=UPI0037DAD6B1
MTKVRDLTRYEDKYSPDPSKEQKLTGHGYEDALLNPVEVLIQVSSKVTETFLNESNTRDFQVLKELDSGDVRLVTVPTTFRCYCVSLKRGYLMQRCLHLTGYATC